MLALIIDAPGLRVLDDHRQTVLVPPDGDSEPVKFDLIGEIRGHGGSRSRPGMAAASWAS